MSGFEPDFHHFQNFWIEQQKTAKHMDRDAAWAHIEGFIKGHNTCGFATGYGDYIRCTPIEYTYMVRQRGRQQVHRPREEPEREFGHLRVLREPQGLPRPPGHGPGGVLQQHLG